MIDLRIISKLELVFIIVIGITFSTLLVINQSYIAAIIVLCFFFVVIAHFKKVLSLSKDNLVVSYFLGIKKNKIYSYTDILNVTIEPVRGWGITMLLKIGKRRFITIPVTLINSNAKLRATVELLRNHNVKLKDINSINKFLGIDKVTVSSSGDKKR